MGEIYKQIKELKDYEYKLGKDELEYLYLSDNLPVTEQLDLADCLAEKIVSLYKKGEKENVALCPNFHLQNSPLICYMNPLLNKINILIMEEVLEKRWIEELTENLIYKGENPWEVKLGLILSSRYLSEEKLEELFEVFSKSGEYIFYLMNTIRNLKKYNNYLIQLSKKVKGTIKVFAITNIEYFSLDIISYMIEEGYRDEIYKELLINYIFTTLNLGSYLDQCFEKNKLDNLSYIICSYLRKNEFSAIKSKYELIYSYLPLITEIGDNYDNLNSIYLIREGVLEDETLKLDINELEKKLDKLLEDEKWISIFENTIEEGVGKSQDIIELADFYEYKLEFKDLLPYLKRDYKDFNVYCYLIDEGSKEDKIEVFKFFKNHFDIDKFCIDIQDIDDEELKKEDLSYIIFSLIVRSLRYIYPHGKDVAIQALGGKINKIRNESIKYIKKYREELNDRELEIVREAYDVEPNYKIKLEIETLICSYENGRKEYVDISDFITYEHVGDIYLINTEVSGCQFRHRGTLEEELENSSILNLELDVSNPYDNKAIKVAGESGFVIGFISNKDNYILSNILRGGKYLYGKIEKYNLENNRIDIRIYLSFKDVIESINDTMSMLHGSNTGGFLN